MHKVSEVTSIIKDHIEGLPVRPENCLFDTPDVFFIRLPLPCIHCHTTLGDGGSSVVLCGEDVARAPLHLWRLGGRDGRGRRSEEVSKRGETRKTEESRS